MERNNRQEITLTKGKRVPTEEYVPAELNLESIGYFSASVKRMYPGDGQKSKVVNLNNANRIVEIVANPKYGFPNAQDLDYYRAFLKICDERAIPEIVQDGDRVIIASKTSSPDRILYSRDYSQQWTDGKRSGARRGAELGEALYLYKY